MFFKVQDYNKLQLLRVWLFGSASKHFNEWTDSCPSSRSFIETLNDLKDLIYYQQESSLLIHLLLGLIRVEKFYSASDSTSALNVTFLGLYGICSL